MQGGYVSNPEEGRMRFARNCLQRDGCFDGGADSVTDHQNLRSAFSGLQREAGDGSGIIDFFNRL
jgi:hypothetical protein